MKPQTALLVPALMAHAVLRKDWRNLVLVRAMPIAAMGLLLWLNQHMYGSPLRGPYPWIPGHLLTGLQGLLLSRQKGLVWFAPAIAFALVGWPRLLRERPLEGWMIATFVVPSFLLVATWLYWEGGWCYGPRLIVPLVGIGLVKTLEFGFFQHFLPRWLLFNAIAFGVVVNAIGAFRYWESIHRFPLYMITNAFGALQP